jgi:hypothetical protein
VSAPEQDRNVGTATATIAVIALGAVAAWLVTRRNRRPLVRPAVIVE